MSVLNQPGAMIYTQGFGSRPENVEVPVIQNRAPATTDVLFLVGKTWVDNTNNAAYILTSFTSTSGVLSANWQTTASATGAISSVIGTTNQITVVTASDVATVSLPSAITAPGSLATTTTLASGTTLTAGTSLSVTTSATVGTSITATLGNITATSGNIIATSGNFVVTAAADGIVFTNSAATAGTTTATLNGRVGQVTITTPSIAGGATFAITITNSAITGSSTQVGYWLTGGTTGAALSIQSYANTASQSVVTINNGTGATTNSASLILNFLVLN